MSSRLTLALLACLLAVPVYAACPGSRRCARDRSHCPAESGDFVFCIACSDNGCVVPTTTTSTPTTTVTTTSAAPTTAPPTTATTTTATTTTATTTTGPPLSVTFLWYPGYMQAANVEAWTPNELRCNAWVPTIGIDNATSISFRTSAGGNCGVAIYNADGSSRITTTGAQACNGNMSITSSAFDLAAGTLYQVCSCSDGTNGYVTAHEGTSGNLRGLQNAFTLFHQSTIATSTCTGGAPPLTTGALAMDTANSNGGHNPIMLLLGTNTP
jgi:hypothetical protein